MKKNIAIALVSIGTILFLAAVALFLCPLFSTNCSTHNPLFQAGLPIYFISISIAALGCVFLCYLEPIPDNWGIMDDHMAYLAIFALVSILISLPILIIGHIILGVAILSFGILLIGDVYYLSDSCPGDVIKVEKTNKSHVNKNIKFNQHLGMILNYVPLTILWFSAYTICLYNPIVETKGVVFTFFLIFFGILCIPAMFFSRYLYIKVPLSIFKEKPPVDVIKLEKKPSS